jgi:hypothetical protein
LISTPGDGDDEAVAQKAPQRRDRLAEVVLLDDSVRPESFEERGALDNLARVLEEKDERVERLCRDVERRAALIDQKPPLSVQPKAAEFKASMHRTPKVYRHSRDFTSIHPATTQFHRSGPHAAVA